VRPGDQAVGTRPLGAGAEDVAVELRQVAADGVRGQTGDGQDQLSPRPRRSSNEARNGRMFILVDHEDRENEGDLVIPAQMARPMRSTSWPPMAAG
jgi:hypothetical protein